MAKPGVDNCCLQKLGHFFSLAKNQIQRFGFYILLSRDDTDGFSGKELSCRSFGTTYEHIDIRNLVKKNRIPFDEKWGLTDKESPESLLFLLLLPNSRKSSKIELQRSTRFLKFYTKNCFTNTFENLFVNASRLSS